MLYSFSIFCSYILSYTDLKSINRSHISCCRCMLKTTNHAGVESYIVKNIRNHVEFSMEVSCFMRIKKSCICIWWFYLKVFNLLTLLQPGNANKWFLGEEFLSLLGLVFCLPQGADTDLLSSMDRWGTRSLTHKSAHLLRLSLH